MENNLKLRIKSGILALIVAQSISYATLPKTVAEDIEVKVKYGSFIENPEDENYIRYVVKKGDNTSIISKKMCHHLNAEVTTKYWPVIAFLNNFPRTIRPGDIIVFPNSIEKAEELLLKLKANNWVSRYVQKNKIYSNTKNKDFENLTVIDLLADIYGDIAYTDPNFVDDYLKMLNLHNKYQADTVITDYNEMFEFTNWIPTQDELGYKTTK